jgi:hypothetical protein
MEQDLVVRCAAFEGDRMGELGRAIDAAASMAKYLSEPSLPSQMFSMISAVPEMIWSRLLSSLAVSAGGGAHSGPPVVRFP